MKCRCLTGTARSRDSFTPLRIGSITLVVALVAAPTPDSIAQAQTRDQNNLMISVFAGVVNGPDFFQNIRQRVSLIDGSGREVAVDTMRIGRNSRPGFSLGMGFTYFKSRHFGFTGEFSFLSTKTDDACNIVFRSTLSASSSLNSNFCDSINRESDIAGNINVMVGLLLRGSPAGHAVPYARGMVGISDHGGSSTEVSGLYNGVDRPIIFDPGNASIRPTFGGAIGLMIPAGVGYQIRLELRDQVFHRDVVLGPADALGIAPIGKEWAHHIALTFGVDIVLERQRGRRY